MALSQLRQQISADRREAERARTSRPDYKPFASLNQGSLGEWTPCRREVVRDERRRVVSRQRGEVASRHSELCQLEAEAKARFVGSWARDQRGPPWDLQGAGASWRLSTAGSAATSGP